jgi:hypothetical protein
MWLIPIARKQELIDYFWQYRLVEEAALPPEIGETAKKTTPPKFDKTKKNKTKNKLPPKIDESDNKKNKTKRKRSRKSNRSYKLTKSSSQMFQM